MKQADEFLDLFEQLKIYGQSDIYPFHMPGHKRNQEFLDFGHAIEMDITEIDGFDNLHHPQDMLLKAQKRAAEIYGAAESRFLVNGSSAGLIAAILGCCSRGGRMLVARSCHKSVYHALEMGCVRPIYLYPPLHEALGIYQSIEVETVEEALNKYSDIQAVIITSPTYEGVVSDIAAIAEVVHRHQIPLIVDEAHGAHFGFDVAFPQTAVRLGADIVIQSVHKTLPSLTQTALMHLNGSLINRQRVLKFYLYLQTTSPSYLLMASIDRCMTLLARDGKKLFDNYRQLLTQFLNQCRRLQQICVLRQEDLDSGKVYGFDMSKIVIYLKPGKACGKWLFDLLLNKYHIQLEMASVGYCLAMTSICDTAEGFERLYRALSEIDAMDMMPLSKFPSLPVESRLFEPEIAPGNADGMAEVKVAIGESKGHLCAEYAYVYPPGIPFLAPGERITESHLQKIQSYLAAGLAIEGMRDETLKTMYVLKD